MTALANSTATNLIVPALVLALVFLLPWLDRRLSGRAGLSLRGGAGSNPQAGRLMRLRQAVLCAVFGLYLAAVAYLVFFSRSATRDYQVHVAPFEDLAGSVRIDAGVLGLLKIAAAEGIPAALARIHVVGKRDISQVAMNVMLFVPMGYLLPYTFSWFRTKVRVRPVLACFLASLFIENLQLVFRRGFYDADDLISNTAGGLLGQVLYISVAYVVTHPAWRRELKAYRRWKRNAKTRTLYPFARRIGLTRTTLLAASEEAVWDFYVMKLGFRLVRQIVPLDAPGTDMLLQMGKMQLEVRCANREETLPRQTLTLSVRRIRPVIRRLRENGIDPGPVREDPYTGMRCVRFPGPEGVEITVLAADAGL